MVRASIPRSMSGVTDLFTERNITGIAVVSGLAAFGASISVIIGQKMSDRFGSGSMNTRKDLALFGLGALVTAAGAAYIFSPKIAGSMAVGALALIGISVAGIVVGVSVNKPVSEFQSAGIPTLSGTSINRQPTTPPRIEPSDDEIREIGPGKAVPEGGIR